ncbi:MAG: hypothetical protein KGM24_05505 [Elusimicrobia bacterium]|nr:hypothetical protein [Elusimicrobiota bacterium]
MTQGQWLQPRHGSREAFEKDFPTIATSQIDVVCPGCRASVKLTRRSPNGKSGGWCQKCNRGVGT